jgi:glycosyltransferase involved in cell wall biosynthesis
MASGQPAARENDLSPHHPADEMTQPGSPTVLHLIESLGLGGTERQLVQFIGRSSAPANHVVVTWSEPRDLWTDLPSEPLAPDGPGSGRWNPVSAARLVRDVVRRSNVQVVHTHLSKAELLAAVSVPRHIPIVASRRGRNRHDDRAWFRLAESFSHRRVACMVCNSESLAAFTLGHDHAPPPVVVIPNGVDLDRYAASPLPPEPVVTVVANLRPVKRHDVFLRGLALARRTRPDLRAVLVGDGTERPRIEALASELGVADAVRMTGSVDDVRPFLRETRVVALTSEREGLPNAILEAMAMGRLVVATEVGGIPELVRHGREGFLVSPDPAGVASGLLRAVDPDTDADEIARAARARAESDAWPAVVRRTEDVYRRVVAGERLPRGTRVAIAGEVSP